MRGSGRLRKEFTTAALKAAHHSGVQERMSSFLAGRFPHGVHALLCSASDPGLPPGTGEQGQKSRPKNVVLPAFRGTARGPGWVSRIPLHEAGPRRAGRATSSRGGAGFWKPCCGMQGRGLKPEPAFCPSRPWTGQCVPKAALTRNPVACDHLLEGSSLPPSTHVTLAHTSGWLGSYLSAPAFTGDRFHADSRIINLLKSETHEARRDKFDSDQRQTLFACGLSRAMELPAEP